MVSALASHLPVVMSSNLRLHASAELWSSRVSCSTACRLLEVMRAQGLRPNGSVAFSLVKACALQDQDLARTYVEEFQANGIRRASSCSFQNVCFGVPMLSRGNPFSDMFVVPHCGKQPSSLLPLAADAPETRCCCFADCQTASSGTSSLPKHLPSLLSCPQRP